VTTNQKNSPL